MLGSKNCLDLKKIVSEKDRVNLREGIGLTWGGINHCLTQVSKGQSWRIYLCLHLYYYFYGWVVGLVGNKANLSPSSVGARVGAELGKKQGVF